MKGFAERKPEESLADIFRRNTARNNSFRGKVDRALGRFKIPAKFSQLCDHILGRDRHSADWLASNRLGRDVLTRSLVNRMYAEFEEWPDHKFHFLTLIHDGWQTSNLDVYVDLVDIDARSRQMFEKLKREGVVAIIGFIETQGMGRDEGKGERSIFPHVHAIIVAPERFKPRTTARKLSKLRRLRCKSGAPTVHISKRLKTKEDVARAASYMLKEPFSGKFYKTSGGGKKVRFASTVKGMHLNVCLRLSEILSHLSFPELFLASGKWIKLRRKILNDVHRSKEFRQSHCDQTSHRQAQFWASIPRTDKTAGCPVYVKRKPHGDVANLPPSVKPRQTPEERRQLRAIRARKRRRNARLGRAELGRH
jgi:hypothetical protein